MHRVCLSKHAGGSRLETEADPGDDFEVSAWVTISSPS